LSPPTLRQGRLVLAFSGWMDGGEVSTGSVRWLARHLHAAKVASIDPEDFYLTNFPGSMEVAALFRPQVTVAAGVIQQYQTPRNEFFCAPEQNLVLFLGQEPNLHWQGFGACIFDLARQAGVTDLYFVGTFAGAMPHTRQPRLYASVSDPVLKADLGKLGLRWSDYEGPAGFATHLMHQAPARGMRMVSLVAEVPAYVEGANPPSIETVTRKLAAMLGLQVDLSEMRSASDEWETKVSAAASKDPKLARRIRKLEEQYDDELIDAPPGEP
jgi:proteasome assembly chaperone (PAC2) family protein